MWHPLLPDGVQRGKRRCCIIAALRLGFPAEQSLQRLFERQERSSTCPVPREVCIYITQIG